jgi:proteasome maturation protein
MAWRATQDAMKMESLRRAYGIAEPVRRGMELKIVRDGSFRPAVLGGMKGGNVHEDILSIGGRDTEVQWEDIFHGMSNHQLMLLALRSSVPLLIMDVSRRRVPGATFLPR